MKNFVKVMDQTGPAFRYIAEKFPGISAAKIKEVFSSVLRSASSLEMNSLTIFSVATRRGRGMVSVL
jgi:hypothetical protein